MTLAAIISLLGGWRAAVFAAVAALALAAVGVQSWRLDSAQDERDAWRVAANGALGANRKNEETIGKLRDANAAWAKAARVRNDKATKAVAAVASERDALAAELERRRKQRGQVYERDQDAAAWGRAVVPDSVVRGLRE